jgi:hydrogenase maturation protease
MGELQRGTETTPFSFPAKRWAEPVPGPDAGIAGVIVRERERIEGAVERRAEREADGLFRVTVRVVNHSPGRDSPRPGRDAALLRSLVSVHTLLGVRGGEFVSLFDPPEVWREAAARCQNVGTWPVLVGAEESNDTMLSSPIILYDYPQVAPESPGDFFDGTEMDEMLTLRILTMTDDEKRAMAAVDGRTADLLARTESAARDSLRSLHGTIRSFRPVAENRTHG